MNTTIKKLLKGIETKICYHKNKVREFEEAKKRLMQKSNNEINQKSEEKKEKNIN